MSKQTVEWISAEKELPEIQLGWVLVHIDGNAFDEWSRLSDDNKRFYDDTLRSVPVDVWNTMAVRHWAKEAKWLTHWMKMPKEPRK